MIVLLCLSLALCLARVQYLAVKFNMASRFNGYGAIAAVQAKTADAPMVYRVLVPWLIGKPTMAKYQALQVTFITAALYSVYLAWGLPVMLVTAILLTCTFFFDYWDWAVELAALSLALVSFPLAIAGVILHGMSRETAPLVGLVYALRFQDWLGGLLVALLGFAVLQFVRYVQGAHPLYCDRWMFKRNLRELKKPHMGSPYFSAGLSLLALAGAWLAGWDGLIVPVILGAGWTMAVAAETRVFVPVVPFAALALLGMV
jgi:hypothetical protein